MRVINLSLLRMQLDFLPVVTTQLSLRSVVPRSTPGWHHPQLSCKWSRPITTDLSTDAVPLLSLHTSIH